MTDRLPGMEDDDTFVEVAVPVPLRKTFSYRVPRSMAGELLPGMRVAVPFGGQKLAGFVVGPGARPEGVKRVRDVAGVFEPAPVFPPELFRFLLRAADYYLHPVGEVLRAAAPALPRDATRRLRAEGFLASDEALKGASIATRRETYVFRKVSEPEAKLGASQQKVWDLLAEPAATEAPSAGGGIAMSELRVVVKNARQIVRALEDRGLVRTEERDVSRDRFWSTEVPRDEPRVPTDEQRVAIDAIQAEVRAGATATFLLEGVTGSGKTEVYLQVIDEVRRAGKSALLLVPEIALTPQLVSRFRARFGDAIAVLHSGLTDRDRADAWAALRQGKIVLAIGARSALFAPMPNLGAIVVDEEHDPSFKQEEGFRYHARDMAMLRARDAGAVCVLGSATPAVETRYLADQGRIRRLELRLRATGQSLPTVEIVDLARHRSGPFGSSLLSAPLVRAMERTLASGDQTILFLNRRGFSPSVRCEACGKVAECPTCSVSLTLHRSASLLRCHYCDYATPISESCSECGQPELRELGMGTEKLEDSLQVAFPSARVGRLDRDTASTADEGEHVLARFARKEIDILVGTQMVTKGHDLPGVTLVGVILADQSLAFPDFRAGERTFQLLSQVAGRAGRAEKPGHVIFQTYQPEHQSIVAAAKHDYAAFYAREIADREEVGYSPFARMVSVRVDAGDERTAASAAQMLAELAGKHPCVQDGTVFVLGPAPAPILRLRGRYRYRVLLRGQERARLRAVAERVLQRIEEGIAPARATVDVDPVAML